MSNKIWQYCKVILTVLKNNLVKDTVIQIFKTLIGSIWLDSWQAFDEENNKTVVKLLCNTAETQFAS